MTQRCETTSAVTVVFEEIAIEVGIAEQLFGDEFVTAFCDPRGTEIAAARVHGYRHVGWLTLQRHAGSLCIDCGQGIGIITARLGSIPLFRVAHHRPSSIVELEVAATGVVKGLDRRPPGSGDIGKKFVIPRVSLLTHHRAALPKMERAGRRDRHLRRHPAFALKELEVLDVWMALELDLAVYADCLVFGLDTMKLDPRIGYDRGDTFQSAKKVEVPPCAAKLAISSKLEADFFLLLDDLLNLSIFNRLQCSLF